MVPPSPPYLWQIGQMRMHWGPQVRAVLPRLWVGHTAQDHRAPEVPWGDRPQHACWRIAWCSITGSQGATGPKRPVETCYPNVTTPSEPWGLTQVRARTFSTFVYAVAPRLISLNFLAAS